MHKTLRENFLEGKRQAWFDRRPDLEETVTLHLGVSGPEAPGSEYKSSKHSVDQRVGPGYRHICCLADEDRSCGAGDSVGA